MYRKILVPVDLGHIDEMSKALDTAIDIARHYDATLYYVAVTNTTPSSVSHNPSELADKLQAFADEQGKRHGVDTDIEVIAATDTAVELTDRLVKTIHETNVDLVVMASHKPGIGDKLHYLHSNAANIVKHSDVSVFVVR